MNKYLELNDVAAKRFREVFGANPEIIAWAPGRINLIGEHTDYNDGLAMPVGIDCGVSVGIRRRSDRLVKIHSLNFDAAMTYNLGEDYTPEESWSKYVYGALRILEESHELASGFDAVFIGNVPSGAGLSSSASLLVSWFNALRAFSSANFDDWALVKMAQRVEHEYLSVHCGLLDQIASQFSRPDRLLQIAFLTDEISYAEASMSDHCWVAIHTGKSRELAASAYKQRVEECKLALVNLKSQDANLSSLREAKLSMLQSNTVWEKRVRHLITENQRVSEMKEALSNQDFTKAGELLIEGHKSLRDDYEVSCEELDTLVNLSETSPHWRGGRMMGGGFGGCTINLVHRDGIVEYINQISKTYQDQYPNLQARYFSFESLGGARIE